MIMYVMDHKQIAIPMLNIIVIQILNTHVIQTHNTTVITTLLVTILAKAIVALTQIQEDAVDIEDNLVSILKAYSTKCTIGFCRILQEYYLIHQNTIRLNMATYFYQEFILLKYSMAFGENSTNVFP